MKKNRNFIFKICSALLMALIFVLSFTCKSYAWYVNDDGNLVGSNLVDDDLTFVQGGGSGSFTNQDSWFTFNVYNSSDFYVFSSNTLSLEAGTYTFSLTSYEHIQIFVIMVNGSWLASSASTHTLTFETNTNISIRIDSDESFVGSFNFGLMVNSGSVALSWEPYGIWYSETNYNNNGISNYNTGFENGLNSITSMFRQCSRVEQTINNVTTTFTSTSINDSAFENWFNQSNGTICSFSDGSIVINYAQLRVQNNLDYGFSYGLRFYFGSFTPNTLHYDYYSFASNVPCNIYVYCDGFSFFDSDGELFIDNTTGYDIQSVYFYVSSANPGPLYWYLTTVDDTSSAYSSGYIQGQEVGYNNGYSAGYDNGVSDGEISGFNNGYAQGSNSQTTARRLFWTIASTPFESFKTIWNVDVLGLNISGIILGILMALLVIYLIKKIWR